MPFDGIGFAFDDRVSKIDQVISLLDTRDKWCKGNFKTPDGRHCIRGAIKAVEGAEVLQPIVLRAIHEATGQRFMRIESFNDHPYTRPGAKGPSIHTSPFDERKIERQQCRYPRRLGGTVGCRPGSKGFHAQTEIQFTTV